MRSRVVTRPPISLKAWDALDRLCRELAANRPVPLLLTLSLLTASLWCASLLDLGFVLGTSAFWKNPHGVVGYGWADMPQTLSGYFFFQRDSWHIPLFHVAALGPPDGTNIIFTDSIPWVALAGRLLFQATGIPVNLYEIWVCRVFRRLSHGHDRSGGGTRSTQPGGRGDGVAGWALHASTARPLGPYVADGPV